MTSDDNNSTLGASASTVLAAIVAGHVAAARASGLPADQLAADSGLDLAALSDPDSRVPSAAFVAFWEKLEPLPQARALAIALGRGVTVQTLGVVGYAMQHAQNVQEAFACLARFRALIGDFASPDIAVQDERVLFYKVEPPRVARLSSLALTAPLGTITLLRELTGLPESREIAVEATFQHPPPSDAADYSALLGCPVKFSAPRTQFAIHRSVFDQALRRPDPSLFGYLERHATALQQQLRQTDTITDRVRQHLIESVRDGEPEQRDIARKLGLSERTLQRRLRSEETSFATLLDSVRNELAVMYLDDPQLAIFEVAYLLGFSDPSAFNRAFRRWTNLTPRDYRRGA
jgi:AraC-like DNA-binding protein